MSFQTVSVGSVAPQAWRNGGGQTRELLAWPQASDWTVRISLADIESNGAFSSFAGVQRWFAVVQGGAVQLRFPHTTEVVGTADAPLCFDGALAPDCTMLAGPTRDLNLMLRGVHGGMQRLHGVLHREFDARVLIALYAASEPVQVQFDSEPSMALAPGTLVWRWLDAPGKVRAEGLDALWLEARP